MISTVIVSNDSRLFLVIDDYFAVFNTRSGQINTSFEVNISTFTFFSACKFIIIVSEDEDDALMCISCA